MGKGRVDRRVYGQEGIGWEKKPADINSTGMRQDIISVSSLIYSLLDSALAKWLALISEKALG